MPKVSDLRIKIQNGTTNTCVAVWEFKEETKSTTTTTSGGGSVKNGDLVSISENATYYNGVAIPAWVKNQKWYIIELSGDRAVLGKNESGTNNIASPINVKYLSNGSSDSSASTTTTITETSEYTKTLDHYKVTWQYDTGDGIWFMGNTSDVTEKYATYTPPSNAGRIKVKVLPVAQTHEVNEEQVAYWNGTESELIYSATAMPPEKPSTPTVQIDKYRLTASLENISDPRADKIRFEVCTDKKVINTGIVNVSIRRATYSCNVESGAQYRVRAQSINLDHRSFVYGEWSDYSNRIGTIPSAPAGITLCQATSKTSVRLEWSNVSSAESYDIEYTTESKYFDNSDQTSVISDIAYNHFEVTGLETGREYFFRVRAVNAQGDSGWTGVVSVVIGKEPAAPTTWSSTTTVVTGEKLSLYWVHNSEDGSNQTYAELELYFNGTKETKTIQSADPEQNKTNSYVIDTSAMTEGSTLQWRVRTAGVTKAFGEWSVQRTIDVYAPATLSLSMTDAQGVSLEELSTFPFYIQALSGPKTQSPVSYHLSVKSNEIYETVDQVGNSKLVNKDEEVFSRYFDTSEPLLVEMSAGNIDLENNISYTVTCVVSMNSGLTCTESLTFRVNWQDVTYEPDAEIGINSDACVAYIRPYCVDDNGDIIEDAVLSVYRRAYDGSFTELATGLMNGTNVHITDPHPALDYARYRIVATSKANGSVSYYDPPGYPIHCESIILQWDEAWSSFETGNSDAMASPAWAGSLLKLPYNIDVADDNDMDVTLVKYAGRKNPVSYYGTQQGIASTWNVVIPKKDTETLYAIRRLAIWAGDVYVREPHGSGYWAHVKVSYSLKHTELTVPVTLSITRVEGGI